MKYYVVSILQGCAIKPRNKIYANSLEEAKNLIANKEKNRYEGLKKLGFISEDEWPEYSFYVVPASEFNKSLKQFIETGDRVGELQEITAEVATPYFEAVNNLRENHEYFAFKFGNKVCDFAPRFTCSDGTAYWCLAI